MVGYNDPVSGNAIINLLVKLATLKRCCQFKILLFFFFFVLLDYIYAVVDVNIKLRSVFYRFSELSLSGLKLSKPVVDSLCQLAKTSSLSGLMLGGTGIGTVSFYVILSSCYYCSLSTPLGILSPASCDSIDLFAGWGITIN